jgi:hypothetical protein
MKPKLGRPEMPQGKANTLITNLRISQDISDAIEKSVKQTKEEKPEWMRDAFMEKAKNPPKFFKSNWKAAELDGALIEFQLNSPNRVLSGIGQVKARENDRGEIAVDIFVDEQKKGYLTRIWLGQDAVDEIKPHPDQKKAKFRILG